MARAHNFFAGPAVLPLEVVKETQEALSDFSGTGVSIMEISHRSKEFDAVMTEAQNDTLDIMGLSNDEYAVIFVGGGASSQFYTLPYNFLHKKADYVNTGVWSKKAIKEAKQLGEINIAASSEETNFNFIPKKFNFSPDADYVHITTNNTIYGTEFKDTPDTGNVPLVADMSSNMLSRPLDYSKYSLIYAGAQKNIGPSGVTMIVLKKSWYKEKAKSGLATILSYGTHIESGSMFNTPPTLPVFVVGRTLKWIKKLGGLDAVLANNEKKAGLIYNVIDSSANFYRGAVKNVEDRSLMNITFNLPTEELEAKFISEAKEKNMLGLKGHRSVGGVRASVYNACPIKSCEALAKHMEEFAKANK